MKIFFILILFLSSTILSAQNIDYESEIIEFYASDCGNDFGWGSTEEHTWNGWISDDVNTTETASGCQTLDANAPSSLFGSFATRTMNNTSATELRFRIDAWEDDGGNRCTFDDLSFWNLNEDDCRSVDNCTYNLSSPLEYQWTTVSPICGLNDYHMQLKCKYRYATTSLADAVEESTQSYTTAGNRPFWGARGSWGYTGNDCAVSGTIENNESSSFTTTVSCKSQLSFRWKVDSEFNYDFLEIYVNGVRKDRISGSTTWALKTINLDYGSNTIEWRYSKDNTTSNGLDRGFVDQITFVDATTNIAGRIDGNQTICAGNIPNTLTSINDGNAYSTTLYYQWQQSNDKLTWTDISGANSVNYSPTVALVQTQYYRRKLEDGCGIVNYSDTVTVTVNTNSTIPTITPVNQKVCPNSSLTLSANGGIAGTSALTQWFSGSNGTGTLLGTGNTLVVNPTTTTTYYARRSGTCNTTADAVETVEVKAYTYAPVGSSVAVDYCTDNTGWHHFYTNTDEIIFSMYGDLTGASSNPVVTIANHGSHYQTTIGAVGSCTNGLSSGTELFELPRSWNVDFSGTTNGSYSIRYYFPANEKTDLETVASNHINNNATCGYAYTYPTPNGFYWFKNIGTAYTAPLFDQTTKLTGSMGSISGVNYAEITGITSFSGGSGAISLTPNSILPIALSSFEGWGNGKYNTLEWSTESEFNNSHFELERSTDGFHFEHLTTVEGAGTSQVLNRYTYTDESPLLGVNYYRLRQVDYDGTSSLSNVIAIQSNNTQRRPQFFPNPTTGLLTYQFYTTHQTTLTLQVRNMLGQVLDTWSYQSIQGLNSKTLDWSAYPAGSYHISVYNKEGHLQHAETIIKKAP